MAVTHSLFAGDRWAIPIQFVDALGNPRPIAAGETPGALLYSVSIGATFDVTIANGRLVMTSPTTGQGFAYIETAVTASIPAPQPQVAATQNYPVRLHGFITDSSGARQTYFVDPIVVTDPRTCDVQATGLPQPPAIGIVGPAGPAGQTASDSMFWTEFKAVTVLQSASGTAGQSRPSGSSSGSAGPYGTFVAKVFSTVSGTLQIVNEDNPSLSESFAVPANTAVTAKAPVLSSGYHCVFSPSATAVVSLSNGYVS